MQTKVRKVKAENTKLIKDISKEVVLDLKDRVEKLNNNAEDSTQIQTVESRKNKYIQFFGQFHILESSYIKDQKWLESNAEMVLDTDNFKKDSNVDPHELDLYKLKTPDGHSAFDFINRYIEASNTYIKAHPQKYKHNKGAPYFKESFTIEEQHKGAMIQSANFMEAEEAEEIMDLVIDMIGNDIDPIPAKDNEILISGQCNADIEPSSTISFSSELRKNHN